MMEGIRFVLNDLHISLTDVNDSDDNIIFEELASSTEWAKNSTWLSYATELGISNIYFFTPELYNALAIVTGIEFGYWNGKVGSSDIELRLI